MIVFNKFLVIFFTDQKNIGFFHSIGNLAVRGRLLKIILRSQQTDSPQNFNIRMLIMA